MRISKHSFSFFLSAAVAVAGFTGCSSGNVEPASPVGGVVTLDGNPLPKAGVSFSQTNAAPGRPAGLYTGVTDEQGRYTLSSALTGSDSVTPGTYKVTLTTANVESGGSNYGPPPPELVPAEYRDGSQTIDIPESGKRDANFDLKSK